MSITTPKAPRGQGRTASFSSGVAQPPPVRNGTPFSPGLGGLEAFSPPTGNGMAKGPTGADRQYIGGGEMASPNGMSPGTYDAKISENQQRNV